MVIKLPRSRESTPVAVLRLDANTNKYHHIHTNMTGKDQVQFLLNFEKEYDTLIKTNPTSGAQVTWRAFMN